MVDAASGGRSILGRSIEKVDAGIRKAAFYDFLRYDSFDLGRFSEENPATAITGSEGADSGTPGDLSFGNGYKYDLTCGRLCFDLAVMVGKPTSIDVLTATKSWLVKFRPSRTNEYRGAEFYLNEGGAVDSLESQYQYGRRCAALTLGEEANQRIKVDTDYGKDALGDTTAAFAVAKTGNTGTYVGKIGSRGRRLYDADYLAKKSVFLKVSALGTQVVNGVTYDTVTLVAQIATAGDGVGGGFPVGAYGAATFVVKPPISAIGHRGWTNVLVGTVTIVGLGGNNKELFEVAFSGVTTNLAVGDEFEIPYQLGIISTTTTTESLFSAFHLERKIVNESINVKTSKGTLKLLRPYEGYKVNGQRFADSIDPTGVVSAELVFTRRLFDSLFRHYNDVGTRFSAYSKYQIVTPIAGTTDDHEAVEVYMPRAVIASNKTGAVASRETLEENPTLRAEQPDGTETPPTGFENTFVFGVNVVTSVDPTSLGT